MPNRVRRSLDPSVVMARRELMQMILLEATRKGAEELETSGLGFVLSAFSYWAMEAQETGLGKPVAKYLRALADMTDAPTEQKKMAAEMRRRKAFDQTSRLAEQIEENGGFFDRMDPNDPQP